MRIGIPPAGRQWPRVPAAPEFQGIRPFTELRHTARYFAKRYIDGS